MESKSNSEHHQSSTTDTTIITSRKICDRVLGDQWIKSGATSTRNSGSRGPRRRHAPNKAGKLSSNRPRTFWTPASFVALVEAAGLHPHHQQDYGEESSKRLTLDGHRNDHENQIANSEHDQRQDHERPEAGARAVSFPEEEKCLERGRLCCREIGSTAREHGKDLQVENLHNPTRKAAVFTKWYSEWYFPRQCQFPSSCLAIQ